MTESTRPIEPIDSDVDLHLPAERSELIGEHLPVLGAIGLGGGLGAIARLGITKLVPAQPAGFPLNTFLINVSGCFLIGVLMVLVIEKWSVHHLVRPFLGVGILGGFTTFSTYTNEFRELLAKGNSLTAMVYLLGTAITALFTVWLGTWLTRSATGRQDAA